MDLSELGAARFDERVRAVREDVDPDALPKTGPAGKSSAAVGVGSCSFMDETMDDVELLEAIEDAGATTPVEAVAKMRELNALLWDYD